MADRRWQRPPTCSSSKDARGMQKSLILGRYTAGTSTLERCWKCDALLTRSSLLEVFSGRPKVKLVSPPQNQMLVNGAGPGGLLWTYITSSTSLVSVTQPPTRPGAQDLSRSGPGPSPHLIMTQGCWDSLLNPSGALLGQSTQEGGRPLANPQQPSFT